MNQVKAKIIDLFDIFISVGDCPNIFRLIRVEGICLGYSAICMESAKGSVI